MERTHLLSEERLKADMPIKNVDSAFITPAIQLAQDLGLQTIIGTNLLDKLCNLVKEDTIGDTSNAKYKKLIDKYIIPYLEHQTMYELEPMLYAKMRNNGIVQSVGDGYTNISHQDSEYIRSKHAINANSYSERMIAFLSTNANTYPEWRQTRDSSDIPANNNAFNCPIYFG